MTWRQRLLVWVTQALGRGLPAPMDQLVTSGPGALAWRGDARRGTRELLASYRELPWLRTVTSRLARGVAQCPWTVYVAVDTPSPARARVQLARGAGGLYHDVGRAPAFDWARDRSVPDAWLCSERLEDRAARRVELAAEGRLREVPDHPLAQLLSRPCPQLTGMAARQVTQVHLDIAGEAFWALVRRGGVPVEAWPLPPSWVREVPTPANGGQFRIDILGRMVDVASADVVWFRDPDPSNPYGRGTGLAFALGDELESDEYATRFVKSWFVNDATPSFIAGVKGIASTEELVRAEERYTEKFRNPSNRGRGFFTTGEVTITKLDTSFKDQQLLELRRYHRDMIAQVFNVPPEIIGIITNSNRSTIGAARYILALGAEQPRLEYLRQEYQAQLADPHWPDAVPDYNLAVPMDEAHQLRVFSAQPQAFLLNEWRELAGRAPLEQLEGKFPAPMPGQDSTGGEPGDEEQGEGGPTPAADHDEPAETAA
jgi:hypothetical protein